jgi:hypothetical protein
MADEDSNMIFSSSSSGSHLARPYQTPPCTLILEISLPETFFMFEYQVMFYLCSFSLLSATTPALLT